MRPTPLLLTAGLLLLALAWSALTPAATHANQHAPASTTTQLLEPVEILVQRANGPLQPAATRTVTLYEVPADRTLVITDIQVRADGPAAELLRDGVRVAEASHRLETIGISPALTGQHTSFGSGVVFPPGTEAQLRLPAGFVGQFLAFRGHTQTLDPPLVTVQLP